MPLPISDRRLSQLYKKLEDSNATIDDSEALKILSDVGATTGWSPKQVLSKLQDKSLTQDQKVALLKQNMSAAEKQDLTAIVDKGDVKIADSARSFFESVLGRSTPVTPPPPPAGKSGIALTGDQSKGFSGTAKPGDTIEAINLSAAPTGRLHVDDTTAIATVGADGKFSNAKLSGDQTIKEGDIIRMRARHADGTTGDWLTVKATGVAGSDSRNAEVALFRIGLTANSDGSTIGLANINDGRQISEPGAKLQFTNARTKEKTVVTLNDDGTFDPKAQIPGKAGDTFSVAATDGTNNTDFKIAEGNVIVPGGDGGNTDLVPDPAMYKSELDANGKPMFNKTRYTGPLFNGPPKPTDVRQGQLGDCYVPSGFAALAVQNADAIQKAIKDNGDGTYTVTFKDLDWKSGQYRDVPIKVDGDLYVRSWGGPVYGTTNSDDQDPKTMELWFPLMEKAYAQWKGSYNDIGNGGLSDQIFQSILGRDGQEMNISEGNADAVFTQLKKAFDAGQPVSAGTYGDDQSARYTNTGIYADHSYSVLGYKEKNGEKYVTLRNPWGESEPAGNGPNDGIFDLPLKDFAHLYQTLMYTNPK
jgi:hypothetical protein